MIRKIGLWLVIALMVFDGRPSSGNSMELTGAGATFPYPLYNEMFSSYRRQFGLLVHYKALGSSEGIGRILKKEIDFAASDAFLTEPERKMAREAVVHIPTCLGAVVIIYNLPSNPPLRFTPDLLADIFLGKIQKWSDPRITAVNQRQSLPDMPITLVHRKDGSGTTFILSEYLSKVSKEWREKVGTGKLLKWPIGESAKHNPGVAGLVQQISGAIGYVELTYALGNDLTMGEIRNKSGRYIRPGVESVTLAAQTPLPADTGISLTDTPALEGYPLTSFTWLIVYREQNYNGRWREQAEELVKLLWWIIHEGQRYTKPLQYAPLPDEAVQKAEALIKTITYKGHKLWP